MVEDDSQMDSPLVRFHLVFRRREPISAQLVARPNPAVNSSLPHFSLDRLWVPFGQQALSCCYESVTPTTALSTIIVLSWSIVTLMPSPR